MKKLIARHKIPDFAFSSEQVKATAKFNKNITIIAYVEGFEDITFWHLAFSRQGLNVQVKAIFTQEHSSANGKGTIIKAIKENNIILGPNLLTCLDSDYDLLTNRNQTILNNRYCFQTYTYAIENFYYNPIGLTNICCQICNNFDIDQHLLEKIFMAWSTQHHSLFLQMLKHSQETQQFQTCHQQLQQSLIALQLDSPASSQTTPKQNAQLQANNVFMFYRGHDIQHTVERLCKILKNKLTRQTIDDIGDQAENSGQIKKEYINHQGDLKTAIKMRSDIDTHPIFSKITQDIQQFKLENTA